MRKRLIRGIGITMVCFLLFLLPVKAANPSVSLKENGNDVTAVLELSDNMAATEVVSLQLSFEVDKKPAEEEIKFVFDNKIESNSVVAEPRYHQESGRLNIYISGTENLFKKENLLEGNKLSLGTIVLSENVKNATVSVVEDSLIIVNSAFDMEEIKLSESLVAKPGEITNPETPDNSSRPGNNGSSNNWESSSSSRYPNRPGGSHLIPIDNNNNTPKPMVNVNTNPQSPANNQDPTQPTTKAEDKSQTTANNENATSQPSATKESDSQLTVDNQNNSQNNASNRSEQNPNNNDNNRNNSNRNNNKNNNNNGNHTINETSSFDTGGDVTTELLLLELQPQSEEQTTTDAETESDSTESTQEVVTVSNPNEKEKSSDGNILLMMILGFILVIAAGGAVFVFKLTETPKRKKKR